MSESQRAVTPCSWGVKAGMVCVWVAGKTVWSLHFSSDIRGLHVKCCINSSVFFTFISWVTLGHVFPISASRPSILDPLLRSVLKIGNHTAPVTTQICMQPSILSASNTVLSCGFQCPGRRVWTTQHQSSNASIVLIVFQYLEPFRSSSQEWQMDRWTDKQNGL